VKQLTRPSLLVLPLCLVPFLWGEWGTLIQLGDSNNPIDPGRLIGRILAGWNPDNFGQPSFRETPLLFPFLAFWKAGMALGLSVEMVQRLWLVGLLALSAASAWSLLRLIRGDRPTTWVDVAAVIAYVFNPFTLTNFAVGFQIPFLAYATAPLWLSTYIRTLRAGPSLRSGLRLGLVSLVFASAMNNLAIVLTMIVLPSILVALLLVLTRELAWRQVLLRTSAAMPWLVALNAWWVIPFIAQAVSGSSYSYPGGSSDLLQYPALITPVPFVDFLRGTGYWGLHTGYRGLPYFAWAAYLGHPAVVVATLWLAACSFLALIRSRLQNAWAVAAGFLYLIAVFFSKGVNEPFGDVNRWLFVNVPGFFLFRGTVEKFSGLAFLGLLISLAIFVRGTSHRTPSRLRNGIAAATILAALISTGPMFTGDVVPEPNQNGVRSAIRVPNSYPALRVWTQRTQSPGSVLVVPQTPNGYLKTDWGFAGPDLIYNYSDAPVLIGAPDAREDDGPAIAAFLEAAADFDDSDLLLRRGISHVVVRGDIDTTYYPGTISPETARSRLREGGFELEAVVGEFTIYRVPGADSPFLAASASRAGSLLPLAGAWLDAGTVEGVLVEAPGHVEIRFPQAYDPNWQLEVESLEGRAQGTPEHFQAKGFANGWRVEALGDVRITIRYRRPWLTLGGIVCLTALVVGFLGWVRARRQGRAPIEPR